MNIDSLLNNALVFDIETYAEDKNGKEIDIRTNFNSYIELAQCKWFGAYSYRDKKEYYLEVSKDREKIVRLLSEHTILIGFNSEEFDYPILVNNHFVDERTIYNHIDCMKILGSSTFRDKNGYKYKGRGELMGYKFKSNSLRCMAETMGLQYQKSTIDYKIFKKDIYTNEEKQEIIKYLKNDVMATKELFDRLWNYWLPFIDLLDWKYVSNFSWVKSSIASLIYKSACYSMGVEPTYSEHQGKTEEMGGRVLDPKYEEAENVWYVDFTSLYPHIFSMFNLFAEVKEDTKNAWHGNEMFKVKGYYDVSYHHKLAKVVKEKLKQRIELKAKDKTNPMVYTLKIWLNGLYGVTRSAIFEKVHTKNCGWDCCWLGQQIQEFTQKELEKYGFESIAGDTDSLFVVSKSKKHLDRDYIKICLQKIIEKILANVPFPVETFNIDIETFIPYIMFPFSEQSIMDEETGKNKKEGKKLLKERKGRKKNYLFLYEDKNELKVKIVGLPIKKDGSTELGMKIYTEILEPKILKEKRAKFSKEFIDSQIEEYLKKKEIMQLISREFKVKPANTYKVDSSIYAQISNGYFSGGEGVIKLIKNNKIGKAGKGELYCTIDEAIKAKLTVNDLDLEKLMNEIEPFVEYQENLTNPVKNAILIAERSKE